MLPSIDEYLHSKNLKYQLISLKDIVDQRILQSDWTRGTPRHTQPKMAVLDVPSLEKYPQVKKSKISMVLSSDFADYRILETDWIRSTACHTQPQVILYASFP